MFKNFLKTILRLFVYVVQLTFTIHYKTIVIVLVIWGCYLTVVIRLIKSKKVNRE